MLLPDVPKLEIRSVDGFQGGEREAVVISLVRSSDRGGKDGIGFLRDERRLNVAVTRAKRHCAVICDTETCTKDRFIKGLVDWMEMKGEYRSGSEYDAASHNNGSESSLRSNNIMPAAKVQKHTAQKERLTKIKGDTEPRESIGLMEIMNSLSKSGNKGEKIPLSTLLGNDSDAAQELATQLSLGCSAGEDHGKFVIEVLKEAKSDTDALLPEEIHANNESKFAQLDGDDESLDLNDGVDEIIPSNNLLRALAMEREKRHSEQPISQTAKPPVAKQKMKGKANRQKLGGQQHRKKEITDELDGLDDMAFLDAQIEKVQNSHGRKIDAKGKGYRSVVNGILISTPSREEPKRNSTSSSALHAKLKSKEEERKVKKKTNK